MDSQETPQAVVTQRFDLLVSPSTPIDSADTKYVRSVEQQVGFGKLNGWPRALRRVTITGMDLTFDATDRHNLLRFTHQDDLQEIYLVADTLSVDVDLKFPNTRVVIVARKLYFGPEGCVDTSPKNSTYRDPESIDGDPGIKGGDIVLLCGQVIPAGVVHFRTQGSEGQSADEGGYANAPTRKFLAPLTLADWNNLFSSSHRTVPHEMATAIGPTLYQSVLPLPSWTEYHNAYGDALVYAAITNVHYENAFHTQRSSRKTIASVGSTDAPGTGGEAKLPGRPGTGGAGGNVLATAAVASNALDLSGGKSAARHPAVPGGTGGSPERCVHLYWDGYPEGSGHRFSIRVESVNAVSGKASSPGPEALAKQGESGKLLNFVLKDAWALPPLLSTIIQFARDCLSANRPERAIEALNPYRSAVPPSLEAINAALKGGLDDWKLDASVLGSTVAQQQFRSELSLLIDQVEGNFDMFGNPPGWVPSLSLLSTVTLYKSVLESSLQQIYTAYVLEKLWNDKADKSAAMSALVNCLSDKVKGAQDELSGARAQLKPAMDDLSRLVTQISNIADKLDERQSQLSSSADQKVMSDQQKEAVAAGFKISGALLKALPLPEPYQAVAGAVGTVADITSTFISNGGDDAAFDSLKTQVAAFTADDGPLKSLSSDLDDDLKANSRAAKDAETTAALAKAKEEASALSTNNAIATLGAQKAKAEAAQAARDARLKFDKREGTLSAIRLADLDQKLAVANGELTASKVKSAESMRDQGVKKVQRDEVKEKLENQKADREASIKKRVGQLKNITDSVATIGKTINRLMVSQSQLNSAYDKALAAIEAADETFLSLMRQATFLQQKKADLTQRVVQLQTTLASNEQLIVKSLVTISELRGAKANDDGTMDPCVLTYIQALGQDAHQDLKRYLYYVVKAFEYYMVAPWDHSYLTAQKTFEDLRRILDPAEISFKFDPDSENKDQQAKLQELINKPNLRKTNLLSSEDMDLLKIIYQKPLLDMGRKLADALVTGSSRLETSPKPVTLAGEMITQLNANLKESTHANAVPLSLIKLRQIDQKVERQRIVGIKVVRATCRPINSSAMPDQITFTIALDGHSIVRADNKLYAFDPEVKVGPGGSSLPGVTFETSGGKRGKGWVPAPHSPGLMEISGDALWQPDVSAQANLLTAMMSSKHTEDDKHFDLSRFRPGVFSDFVLAVAVTPAGVKIEFDEIDLEISIEKGDANLNSLFLSVDNNLAAAIPIGVSQPDSSGRAGGEGGFVRLYDDAKRATGDPIRVTAPATFGKHAFKGWSVDGSLDLSSAATILVSKDTFLSANYQD